MPILGYNVAKTKLVVDKAEAELQKMLKASGSTSQNLNVLALFYESTEKWDQAEKAHAGPQGEFVLAVQ